MTEFEKLHVVTEGKPVNTDGNKPVCEIMTLRERREWVDAEARKRAELNPGPDDGDMLG